MYELIIKDEFDAAHFLENHHGQCESLHGHTWRVEAVFSGTRIEKKSGLLVDFKKLKSSLADILLKLDHSFLNKNKFLGKLNPSCENLARFIYGSLKKETGHKLKPLIKLERVTVWESASAGVTYFET